MSECANLRRGPRTHGAQPSQSSNDGTIRPGSARRRHRRTRYGRGSGIPGSERGDRRENSPRRRLPLDRLRAFQGAHRVGPACAADGPRRRPGPPWLRRAPRFPHRHGADEVGPPHCRPPRRPRALSRDGGRGSLRGRAFPRPVFRGGHGSGDDPLEAVRGRDGSRCGRPAHSGSRRGRVLDLRKRIRSERTARIHRHFGGRADRDGVRAGVLEARGPGHDRRDGPVHPHQRGSRRRSVHAGPPHRGGDRGPCRRRGGASKPGRRSQGPSHEGWRTDRRRGDLRGHRTPSLHRAGWAWKPPVSKPCGER